MAAGYIYILYSCKSLNERCKFKHMRVRARIELRLLRNPGHGKRILLVVATKSTESAQDPQASVPGTCISPVKISNLRGMTQVKEWHNLFKDGAITDEEYEKENTWRLRRPLIN